MASKRGVTRSAARERFDDLERMRLDLTREGLPFPQKLAVEHARLAAELGVVARAAVAEEVAVAEEPSPTAPASGKRTRRRSPAPRPPPAVAPAAVPRTVQMRVKEASGSAVIAVNNAPVFVGAQDRAERDRQALRAYRRFVVTGCERLSTRLVEREQNDPTHAADAPALANVYVALDTTILEHDTPRRLSVQEVLGREPRVVLVAHAGYGKSTVIGHTALCLAMDGLEPDGPWKEGLAALGARGEEVVPVPIVLRELAASLPDLLPAPTASTLLDFLEERLRQERCGTAIGPLGDALHEGRAIVLLDGLDEVPASGKRNMRAHIRQAILKLAERYPSCRVVVSCRVLTYEEDGPLRGFSRAELAPLDEDKIRTFIRGWYAELSRVRPQISAEEAGRLSAKLEQAVTASRDLLEMAQSPLLLTVMAVVHATLGELPEAEAELYREAVDILLWRWGQVRGQSPKDLLDEVKRQKIDLLVALRQLAYEVHGRTPAQAGGVPDIPAADLVSALKKLDPRRSEVWAEQMLSAVQHRAGLLLPAGEGNYRFPHRTYQELLAGWHLVHQADFVKTAAARLREDATRWRKVVLLGVGLLVRDGNLASVPHLLAELCPRSAGDSTETWRQAFRAGEVLQEVKPERLADTELGREMVDRVRKRLCALLTRGKLAPRERVEAGRRLGHLGDPRFREELWGLPDEEMLGFVRIPAGPFWMGSDKAVDKWAEDDELPRHPVTLPEVWMGRYPVTVGQWRAFVGASGFSPGDHDSLWGAANEPVCRVSWHEAIEYTRWLDTTLRAWPGCPANLNRLLSAGYQVTLPSEAEWEKAARGMDGRVWPWGNTFEEHEKDPANVAMSVGVVSPVGAFPSGGTPEGLHDLAGNVWEWTRSVYKKYPYSLADDREAIREQESRRALRGGSCDRPRQDVRCACRNHYGPRAWGVSVGFRLVLSPFWLCT